MPLARAFLTAAALLLAVLPAAADGPARGGGLRPVPPGIGAGGAGAGQGGGTDLEERRARTQRLRELQGPSSAPGSMERPEPDTPVAPTPLSAGRGIVSLTHGDVRFIADLARVDLMLEVQNVGEQTLEWSHSYPIDPACEVIGATLRRQRAAAVVAHTLTLADAREIYTEIRSPRPRPPTVVPPRRGNSDPLRLERVSPDRLDIALWPIEPGEAVRVELSFVTPLRGRGALRRYVDVLGGPSETISEPLPIERRQPPLASAPLPPAQGVSSGKAMWLIQPGTLTLASAPAEGAEYSGEVAGRHLFRGEAAVTASQPRAAMSFLDSRPGGAQALAVPGGGHGAEVAVWWFDPAAFLTERGYRHSAEFPISLRLSEARGSILRLTRLAFTATDAARPITALLHGGDSELRYHVEVLDRTGTAIESVECVLPVARNPELDAGARGTITAWHRAGVAHRVLAWAGTNSARLAEAYRYAVDLGVLTPGSAALAVPAAERNQLGLRSRRLYDSDGVPLGAQRREADLKRAPDGSLPFPVR